MLRGTLSYREVAHLFQYVDSSRTSGVLTMRDGTREACFYFDHGKLVLAESTQVQLRLTDLLERIGAVTREQINAAVKQQRREGGIRRLGTILCEEQGVPHAKIEAALARLYATIAADVFGWEAGEFLFEVEDPSQKDDMFTLIPSDVILKAGLDAAAVTIQAAHDNDT